MGRPGSFDRDDEESLRPARLPGPLSMMAAGGRLQSTRPDIFYVCGVYLAAENAEKGVGAISRFCVHQKGSGLAERARNVVSPRTRGSRIRACTSATNLITWRSGHLPGKRAECPLQPSYKFVISRRDSCTAAAHLIGKFLSVFLTAPCNAKSDFVLGRSDDRTVRLPHVAWGPVWKKKVAGL